MTPEQRAEARRRLLDLAKCLEIHPALLQPDAIPDAKLRKLMFEVPPDIRSVLDALEVAERERDAARARLAEVVSGLGEQMAAHGTVYTNIAVTLRAERDTARAQVETLADSLVTAIEVLLDFSWEGSSVNFKARTALNTIRDRSDDCARLIEEVKASRLRSQVAIEAAEVEE